MCVYVYVDVDVDLCAVTYLHFFPDTLGTSECGPPPSKAWKSHKKGLQWPNTHFEYTNKQKTFHAQCLLYIPYGWWYTIYDITDSLTISSSCESIFSYFLKK